MDLIAAKKDLLRLVSRCQGVADKKSAMPILADVLLKAEGNALRVSATDLYRSVQGTTECEVAKPGGVCINASDLRERLAAMPDGPVRLRVHKDRAELTAVGTKRRFLLSIQDAEDFPQTDGMKDIPNSSTLVQVSHGVLLSLIDRVHLAVSQDATRAHVNSCLFESFPSGLRLVATDGHRLSVATVGELTGEAVSALVPRTALLELRKLLSAAEDAFLYLYGGGTAYLATGTQDGDDTKDQFLFSCKLVDAQFPPYQQVIPKDSKYTVTVARVPFIDALRAASVASSDRTGGVALEFGPESIRITAQSPEGGEASDEVASTGGPSDPASIGFNAGYLVDALSVLDTDEVTISFSGELDPAVVRAEGFVGVVMPMRI